MIDKTSPPAAMAVRTEGRYQHRLQVGVHELTVDEPTRFGGFDAGPTPYGLLSAALAACTSMTLHFFAAKRGLGLPPFRVEVRHEKIHAQDCMDCLRGAGSKIDRFERRILFDGFVDTATQAAVIEIANRCPVDVTLRSQASVETRVAIGIVAAPPALVDSWTRDRAL